MNRAPHILAHGAVYDLCHNWTGKPIYLCMSVPHPKAKAPISYPADRPPAHEVITAEQAADLKAASLKAWEERLRAKARKTTAAGEGGGQA